MGREQVKEGSHALDICTAFVGRDEIAEMNEVVTRMRGAVNAPLVIDSTELPVLESALELYGGKAILNSINFEDGEGAGGKAHGAGEALRRRGHRPHHRRDRAWPRTSSTRSRSRSGSMISPAAASACRNPTCCSIR